MTKLKSNDSLLAVVSDAVVNIRWPSSLGPCKRKSISTKIEIKNLMLSSF